jgi:hypothetical protein
LFRADVSTSWWATPNPIYSHEILTGVTLFVNLTITDVPTGVEFDVDVQ